MLSKKVVRRLFIFFSLLTFNFSLFTAPTHAQLPQPQPFTAPAAGVVQLQETIARIIALASTFAFFALVIMFVYAGIRFITSNGEPKNVQAAQQIVTWAVIGAGCLVLSWVILLIIGNFTGVDLTNLCFNFQQCT